MLSQSSFKKNLRAEEIKRSTTCQITYDIRKLIIFQFMFQERNISTLFVATTFHLFSELLECIFFLHLCIFVWLMDLTRHHYTWSKASQIIWDEIMKRKSISIGACNCKKTTRKSKCRDIPFYDNLMQNLIIEASSGNIFSRKHS